MRTSLVLPSCNGQADPGARVRGMALHLPHSQILPVGLELEGLGLCQGRAFSLQPLPLGRARGCTGNFLQGSGITGQIAGNALVGLSLFTAGCFMHRIALYRNYNYQKRKWPVENKIILPSTVGHLTTHILERKLLIIYFNKGN